MCAATAAGGQPTQIRRWNMKMLPSDCLILVVGSRDSGKTWIMRDIMFEKQNMRSGIVVSATAKNTKFFDRFHCASATHDLGPRPLEMLRKTKMDELDRHAERASECEDTREGSSSSSASTATPHAPVGFSYCIVDDGSAANKLFRTEVVRDYAMNGRHRNIMTVISAQYLTTIPPEIRSQADVLFHFHERKDDTIKRLYDEYFGVFPSKEAFKRTFFKIVNEPRQCIVWRRTGRCISDTAFAYRARNLDNVKWRIGEDMWQIAKQYGIAPYDKKHTAREAELWKPPPPQPSVSLTQMLNKRKRAREVDSEHNAQRRRTLPHAAAADAYVNGEPTPRRRRTTK